MGINIRLSSWVFQYLNKYCPVEDGDEEVYLYGIEIIVNYFISYVSILILSIVLHCFFEACIYVLVLSLIKAYSDGYHASSFKRCYLLSIVIFLINTIALDALSITIKSVLLVPLCIIGSILLVLFGAHQSITMPKEPSVLKKNKKIMFLIITIINILVFLFYRESTSINVLFTLVCSQLTTSILCLLKQIVQYKVPSNKNITV